MFAFWRFTFLLLLVSATLGQAFFTASPSPTWRRTSLAAATHTETITMMPATIEKESVVITGRPTVLDRPNRVDDPVQQRRGQGHQAWEVRIYNDGLNTREHVARSLVQVTGMSEILAYQTMMQAHQNGMAVVGRWVYEVAEMYHEALKKDGIICDLVPVEEE